MASQGENNTLDRSSSKLDDVPQSQSATTLAGADNEAGAMEGSGSSTDVEKGAKPVVTFPEGGARGWATTAGAAGVLFCTFGYINTWGYDFTFRLMGFVGYLTLKLIYCRFYQEYYQTHQLSGETPSAISWIGSVQGFFIFSGSLVGGPLFDQYGEKVRKHSLI